MQLSNSDQSRPHGIKGAGLRTEQTGISLQPRILKIYKFNPLDRVR